MDNVYEAHIHDKIQTSFYWVTIYIEDTFVWDGLKPIGAVIILQQAKVIPNQVIFFFVLMITITEFKTNS